MYENNKESISIQNEILNKISENNNHEIKSTTRLHTISISLSVEETRISKPNGLSPIIKRLDEIIKELHDSTLELVNTDRERLHIATSNIQNNTLEMIELINSYNTYIEFISNELQKGISHDIILIKEFTQEDIETWKNYNKGV